MTEKVERTEDDWREILSPERYRVLRLKGTERAFSGELLHNDANGVYYCAGCGAPLFSSSAKYDSGSGWPSFFEPVSDDSIKEQEDTSMGMLRIEIVCARCDGHIGHVFDDGPHPTGLRYCTNSASLEFRQKE